jgi:hypothetical protein
MAGKIQTATRFGDLTQRMIMGAALYSPSSGGNALTDGGLYQFVVF